MKSFPSELRESVESDVEREDGGQQENKDLWINQGTQSSQRLKEQAQGLQGVSTRSSAYVL